MKFCPYCGAVDGTPHDRDCLVAISGRAARDLIHRAIGHLRRAEGHARLGKWAKMHGAISDANVAEHEAREVADESRLEEEEASRG